MGMMDALIDFLTGKTAERLQRLETQAAEATARIATATADFARMQNARPISTDFHQYLPATRETIAKGLYQCQERGTDTTQHLNVAGYLFTLKYVHSSQTFTLSDMPWYHIEKRDGLWNENKVTGDISGNRIIIDEVNTSLNQLMRMIRGDHKSQIAAIEEVQQ